MSVARRHRAAADAGLLPPMAPWGTVYRWFARFRDNGTWETVNHHLAVRDRRWVVERFFASINRNRRLAKDVEATIASAEAFLYAASAIVLLRRLAR